MKDCSEHYLTLAADLIISSFIFNRSKPQFQYHRDNANFFLKNENLCVWTLRFLFENGH